MSQGAAKVAKLCKDYLCKDQNIIDFSTYNLGHTGHILRGFNSARSWPCLLTRFQVSTLFPFVVITENVRMIFWEKNVEINFRSSKSQADLKLAFLGLSNHAIHELAHLTRYHEPHSETSKWTFEFRISSWQNSKSK